MKNLFVKTKNLQKILQILENPKEFTLKNRVFHNFDNSSSFAKCLQVSEEYIEVIYDSPRNEEYRNLSIMATMTDEEKNELHLPKHLIPVDCKNLEFCGGGAVIRYSSSELKKYIHENTTKMNSSKLLNEEK
jgi:hypothetical protein